MLAYVASMANKWLRGGGLGVNHRLAICVAGARRNAMAHRRRRRSIITTASACWRNEIGWRLAWRIMAGVMAVGWRLSANHGLGCILCRPVSSSMRLKAYLASGWLAICGINGWLALA